MDRCDVLVIGGGPAGAAAATAAARAGVRVVLVDRARFPRPKVCGDALSNRALEEITRLGAGPALQRAPGAAVRRAVAVLPDGTALPRDYGAEPGRIVTRRVLDHLLVEAAAAAGAEVREGVVVRGLRREGARWAGAETATGALAARVVVAADGPGSVAWGALGAPPPRGRRLALSATAYFAGVTEPPLLGPAGAPGGGAAGGVSAHHFEASLPAGYGWVFPAVEGLANVGVYQRADAYHRGGATLREALEAFLARHPERFAEAHRVGAVRAWQLPLAGLEWPLGAPGLLVAGDAARTVDPLSGEGIWHALCSGRMAGEAAAEAVADPAREPARFRRYRRELGRAVIWPTAARIGLQDGITALVESGAHRRAWVQRLLGWGYGSSALEVSKTTA